MSSAAASVVVGAWVVVVTAAVVVVASSVVVCSSVVVAGSVVAGASVVRGAFVYKTRSEYSFDIFVIKSNVQFKLYWKSWNGEKRYCRNT